MRKRLKQAMEDLHQVRYDIAQTIAGIEPDTKQIHATYICQSLYRKEQKKDRLLAYIRRHSSPKEFSQFIKTLIPWI